MRTYTVSGKRMVLLLLMLIFIARINAQSEDFILNQGTNTASICPGTTALFTTEIINSGSDESQYTVTLSGSASRFALSVPSGFVLKQGERKNVYTYVTPKSSTPAGNYVLDVSISTSKGLIKKVSYNVNVRDCYGVTVSSQPSQQICPCELVKYDFIITNTGEFQETYALSVSGSAVSYVKLSETSVTIPARQSKTIFAYVQNLCTIGTDEFTVTATGKEVASATSSVEVAACFDYSVISQKDFLSMCDHSSQTLPITIKNDGTKSNQYALSIDGPTWANLEKTSLVLGSGQSGSVNLILSPDYNQVGTFSVNFKAVSQIGEIEAIKPLNVEVKSCNSVLIEIQEQEDRICAGLEKNYQAIVRNTGEVRNDFRVSITGPEWSGIDKQLISLDAGNQESLNIRLDPDDDVGSGSQEIGILVETTDGVVTSEDEFTVEIVSSQDCFKPSLTLESDSLDISLESSATVPITIANNGVEDASYELAVSGDAAGFTQLNPSSLRLDAGASEVVYLYVSPVEGIDEGSYKATVTVKLMDSPVLDSKTVNINVLLGEETTAEFVEDETTIEAIELETNETGLEPVTGQSINIGEKVYDYRWYIVAAFIILIAIIVFIRIRERRVPIEQWEREIYEDKMETNHYKGISRKTWIWITGFVIALALFVLGWLYADAIRAYIYYIIGGIALLIVLLIIIKYKDAVIKFFEEEPETTHAKVEQKPVAAMQSSKIEHVHEHKPAVQPAVQNIEHKVEQPKEQHTDHKQPAKETKIKKTEKKSDEELYY